MEELNLYALLCVHVMSLNNIILNSSRLTVVQLTAWFLDGKTSICFSCVVQVNLCNYQAYCSTISLAVIYLIIFIS